MTALETALTGLSLGTPVTHANLTLFPLFGGDAGAYLVRTDGTGRIGLQCIVGGPNIIMQPAFHGSLARQQGTQAIAKHFAFGGIDTGRPHRLHQTGHFIGQGDAELLGCAHIRLHEKNRI